MVLIGPIQLFETLKKRRCWLASIARLKRPKSYVRVAALPKNSYGKAFKTALRSRLEGEIRLSDDHDAIG